MKIPQNFDRWMFDYMEGNLSAAELETFEQFLLQNPDFEVDADAWQNSIIPIAAATYPNQSSLERKRRFAGWYGWSAAAMLTLLVATGGYLTMNYNQANESSLEMGRFTKSDFNALPAQHVLADNSLINDSNSDAINGERNNAAIGATTYGASISGLQNNPDQRQGIAVANGSNNPNETALSNTGDEVINSPYDDGDYYVTVSNALKQEQAKYNSDNHAAKYAHNPEERNIDLNLAKKKNTVKLNSFSSFTKRMYRKIEKMLSYPVGLVNLRDPSLILPENSLLSSNPGFAGGMLMPRFEMTYRNQWLGSDQNAHIAKFSYDNYVNSLRGGFGISVNSATYNDGAFGDYSVDLSYSPKISLSKNVVFEPGVKVSLGVLTSNASKFNEGSSLELDRGMVLANTMTSDIDRTDKQWYKDYGLGFVLNTKWFYVGFSADNLANHYGNVYRIEGNMEPVQTPVLYNAIIGADYESSNKSTTFSPFISARKFGEQTEAWAGMSLRLNHFTFAAAYSTNQDYTGAIGMKFKKFKLVYQYDRTHTLLTDQQIGSHSIGIRFNGEIKNTRFK